jgi:hypothetical protein
MNANFAVQIYLSLARSATRLIRLPSPRLEDWASLGVRHEGATPSVSSEKICKELKTSILVGSCLPLWKGFCLDIHVGRIPSANVTGE